MNKAYLLLGSNDHPEVNLRRAVGLLRDRCDVIFGVSTSRVYESAAVDGAGTYCNAAAVLDTELSAAALKERVLREIEAKLGRTREPGASVTVDLDLVLFNNDALQLGKRQIPDPAIMQHAYVAVPLADLAGDLPHPVTGEPLREIAARFPADALRLRTDIVL